MAHADCRKHLSRSVAVASMAFLEEAAVASLEEIGEILVLDVGKVRAHMFRAVAKLCQELDVYRIGRRAS